jgi:hypothetical protein
MKTNCLIRQILLLGLFCLPCIAGIKGEKKMETEYWPVKPVEIGFNEGVNSLFPVPMEHSFGMVAGKNDHETLRIALIKEKHLHEDIFPRKPLEPFDDIGTCIGDCSTMFLSNRRILSVVDWKSKKLLNEYWGVGEVLQNTYQKTKLIDEQNKIVLTIFSPFYNDSFTRILNNTSSLTLEDIVNKKRIKSIPINTESGNYKTQRRSNVGVEPTVAFGSNYVIYRENAGYKWLCVNNSLENIDHPLKDTLNAYNEDFGSPYVSLEISPTEPYAVAICQKAHGNNFPAVIQWNKAPAVMPVAVTLGKEQYIENSSLQLSPSGRWAYFYITGYPGVRHYLLYIDTSLPGGCLPPFDLQVKINDDDDGEIVRATWMTNPEGLVMKVKGKLLYWDLSKFNANDFLKTQESEFLKKEKAQ